MRHGAPEEIFGVKIGDMKAIVKSIKGNQELALELYEKRNGDAMYPAGMVAYGSQMTKKQLDECIRSSNRQPLAEYTIAVATYVKPLLKNTKQTAKEIGVVEGDM